MTKFDYTLAQENILLKEPLRKAKKINSLLAALFFCFIFLNTSRSFAQQPKIVAAIDSSHIKIGEQIIYKISVETDSTHLVVFPEGKTFNPLEVVESLKTDTSRLDNRFKLIKEYALTQFDSGSYTIPQQRIIINDRPYLTDSMMVKVADVVVDTTKQKMFPIKPAMEVPQGFEFPNWLWWVLGILLLVALGYYLFKQKKRRDEKAKKLPPFERALFELQQLDESHLLENRETKEYYSKLTEAVRRYLEDEVHLRAMESTTSELITYLELKMAAKELNLSRNTIDDLKKILQRADLAKFANSKPDIITAKEDRSTIEHVIKDTKAAIPEPTEEERLKDEAYRLEQEKRKRRNKVKLAIGGAIAVIIIAVSIIISLNGFSSFRDMIFGNDTKELLEGDWINSDYGDPAVTITTPRVLKRGDFNVPPETQEMMVGGEMFLYGAPREPLFIVLSTVKYRENVQFDLQKSVDGIYANLEEKGAKNIILKDEDFTTIQGIPGKKVYGTLEFPVPNSEQVEKKNYMILNFAQNRGFQQVTVIYAEGDESADEIANRIINSVEFNKSGN